MVMKDLISQSFPNIENAANSLDTEALFMAQGRDVSFQIIWDEGRHNDCINQFLRLLSYPFGCTPHPKNFQTDSTGNWNGCKQNIVDPKFTPKREGPFLITKVLSSLSYQLKLPDTWKIHLVFHASPLSPYLETNFHGPNFPSPPPDLIDNEDKYKIEWILKHRGCPGHHSFLIQ